MSAFKIFPVLCVWGLFTPAITGSLLAQMQTIEYIGEYPNPPFHFATDVVTVGGYAYVATNNSLDIFDVSVPSDPLLVRQYYYQISKGADVDASSQPNLLLHVWPRELVIRERYIYLTNSYYGLRIYEFLSPRELSLLASPDTPGRAREISLQEGYAYVADHTAGLQVMDIRDPAHPKLIGGHDTPGYARGVHVKGDYAYIADRHEGLHIINISDPSNPKLTGTYDTPHWAEGVWVVDNYAFVADGDSGLQVIDVYVPSNPTFVTNCPTDGHAEGIFIHNSLAYLACGTTGFQVLDISSPSNPRLIGAYDTRGYTYKVYSDGNFIYVADYFYFGIYRLRPTSIAISDNEIPKNFQLFQNYPNPFNEETVIHFRLPVTNPAAYTTLKIYNILCQEIRSLVEQAIAAGFHKVEWDGKDENGIEMPSGVYFYKLHCGGFSKVKKMSLLR